MQKPPMYSAIKINGKKLYEYAREGIEVEVPERPITIYKLDLVNAHDDEITIDVKCSKGTYIRSLCVDIGKALGYPAHMTALVRNQSGHFTIDQAVTLEELEENNGPVIPLEEVFSYYDSIVVDERIVMTGQKIKSDKDHNVAVYSKEGKLLAIYGPDGKGSLKSLRGLF